MSGVSPGPRALYQLNQGAHNERWTAIGRLRNRSGRSAPGATVNS
jgi:hypothetical protein